MVIVVTLRSTTIKVNLMITFIYLLLSSFAACFRILRALFLVDPTPFPAEDRFDRVGSTDDRDESIFIFLSVISINVYFFVSSLSAFS